MTSKETTSKPELSPEEQRRRKRERIIIVVLSVVLVGLAVILNRSIYFGADLPISNQIFIFILININLLILLLLVFLVVRNVVKLIYDRKRKVMGSRLRIRLVIAFVALTLLPTTVLFVFALNFITSSIEFWFNVPVEQALENSLSVGRTIYQSAEQQNSYLMERVSYQIQHKNLTAPEKINALSNYLHIVQKEFNVDAIEVYAPDAQRLAYAVSSILDNTSLDRVGAGSLHKIPSKNGVHTISSQNGAGELLRTIGTVPFNTPPVESRAIVVLSRYIPSELSADMASINRGFEEYQQIKLLKRPITFSYYITLSVVALLVVFCAVWFGFYLAKTITIPLMKLAEGTRKVAEGDLSFALNISTDDEIGSLVDAFNKMTRDLRISREQLELSAQMLRQQNIEIEERRRYMEIVLKNVSAGVITIDASGTITTFNMAAENMLNLRAEDILAKHYRKLLPANQVKIAEEIQSTLAESSEETVEMPIRMAIDGRPRSFLTHINTLKDEVGEDIGLVMVIDDLTELEKAQRMAAWREVARRIAHEVKNPLTPITLSAQRLKRKYSTIVNEKVFDECIEMIISHVELIRNLVNEFSEFARFPTANPKPCELPPIIEETIALYREGHPNITFDTNIQNAVPTMNLDRQQIKQAMINLIDNAVTAVRSVGTIGVDISHDPILNTIRIEVTDDGIGISDEDKIRLFEPNFSTKKAGMGLGLTIVNSIITDHNGMISVQDNTPRGAKFVIELPV